MPKAQSLRPSKVADTVRAVGRPCTAVWSQGGVERWFRTDDGRTGTHNPRSGTVTYLPATREIAALLYQGAAATCPDGRTPSVLCECGLFSIRPECAVK